MLPFMDSGLGGKTMADMRWQRVVGHERRKLAHALQERRISCMDSIGSHLDVNSNVPSSRAVMRTIASLSFVILLCMNTGSRADSINESKYTGRNGCGYFGNSISRAVWSWCYNNDQNNMTRCNVSHGSWVQTVEDTCNSIRKNQIAYQTHKMLQNGISTVANPITSW